MGRHMPEVAEGIADAAAAVPVELVLHRLDGYRACCHGTREDRVSILDVEVNADGDLGTSRGNELSLWPWIRQHDHGIADLKFGVTDLAARRVKSEALPCAEGFG